MDLRILENSVNSLTLKANRLPEEKNFVRPTLQRNNGLSKSKSSKKFYFQSLFGYNET